MANAVIVVEDEQDLREAVVDYLMSQGLGATGARDGAELRTLLAGAPADLVILDISLPGEDGLSLCRWLRREHGCGIIMATAAGQPLDRVVGLEIGADDYVVKPYELRELLARVRSVLRRAATRPQTPAPAASPPVGKAAGTIGEDELKFGPFRLDLRGHRLLEQDGSEIELTANEYALVKAFAERPARPLSREAIARLVDGRDLDPEDRSIDVRIARLRKKLENTPSRPQLIRTVRGEGYRYDPAV